MGNYLDTPAGEKSGDIFYNLAFGKDPYYKHQGWLSGRTTTDDNFTFYEKPDLDENAPPVPEGNFIAAKASMYYVSIDPLGKLGWKDNVVRYDTKPAHIIEILSEQASNSYKAFLRKQKISYIVAGKDSLDYNSMLQCLKTDFGIQTLMLGGGGVLNWSFLQENLCDEVSIVIAPVADGSSKTQPLFLTKDGLSQDIPVAFALEEAKKMQDDTLWLRYKVKGKENNGQ